MSGAGASASPGLVGRAQIRVDVGAGRDAEAAEDDGTGSGAAGGEQGEA